MGCATREENWGIVLLPHTPPSEARCVSVTVITGSFCCCEQSVACRMLAAAACHGTQSRPESSNKLMTRSINLLASKHGSCLMYLSNFNTIKEGNCLTASLTYNIVQ